MLTKIANFKHFREHISNALGFLSSTKIGEQAADRYQGLLDAFRGLSQLQMDGRTNGGQRYYARE